jgi:hypothetical protein
LSNQIPIEIFEVIQDRELGLEASMKISGKINSIVVPENVFNELQLATQALLSDMIKKSIIVGLLNYKVMHRVCATTSFGEVFNYIDDFNVLCTLCSNIGRKLQVDEP